MGGDQNVDQLVHPTIVSIRAPAWGATTLGGNWYALTQFQSAPPRGGRLAVHWALDSVRESFNPRPRVGGDPTPFRFRLPFVFQSAPPRGGRQAPPTGVAGTRSVSIRAPAWGATSDLRHALRDVDVSIRAPAWGATGALLPPHERQCFNPRPRVGGDTLDDENRAFVFTFQSAPPRGGRHGEVIFQRAPKIGFNPRPRVGGDLTAEARRVLDASFQSAPPRGGRPAGPAKGGR